MTDIIRMAREAGCIPVRRPEYDNDVQVFATPDVLERFAALVAAAEREACAKVAEQTVCDTHLPTGVKIYGTRAAKAIRARGQLFLGWEWVEA
jgi:hypothetical protein